jgi:phosphatidate cytidylyltransferase
MAAVKIASGGAPLTSARKVLDRITKDEYCRRPKANLLLSSTPKNGKPRSNLATRLITAAIVAPLILLLLFKGPVWGFTALILGAVALSAVEFFNMSHPGDAVARVFGVLVTMSVSAVIFWCSEDPRTLVTTLAALPLLSILFALFRLGDIPTAAARMAATTFGPLWLSLLTFLALMRDKQGDLGPGYVLMTLMFAWLADSCGYFAGRFLGKHKLYEAVSPKKTVEGLVGALSGAMLGALLAHFWYLPEIPLVHALGLALVAGLCGQLGDLGESLLKRSTGVKDSGEIVPGHGGMLDRLDALFVTSALVYLYTLWH